MPLTQPHNVLNYNPKTSIHIGHTSTSSGKKKYELDPRVVTAATVFKAWRSSQDALVAIPKTFHNFFGPKGTHGTRKYMYK